jgi:hypothetical protein
MMSDAMMVLVTFKGSQLMEKRGIVREIVVRVGV